jgi:RNA polymerase-binding transcription factor DksA
MTVNHADLRAHHDRLSSLVESLRATLGNIVDAATDVATDDEHDPEGHTIAFERQQTAALLGDAEHQLAEIEMAIERFDAGTYGRCESCGRPIPFERLEAMPSARRCVGCAEAGA